MVMLRCILSKVTASGCSAFTRCSIMSTIKIARVPDRILMFMAFLAWGHNFPGCKEKMEMIFPQIYRKKVTLKYKRRRRWSRIREAEKGLRREINRWKKKWKRGMEVAIASGDRKDRMGVRRGKREWGAKKVHFVHLQCRMSVVTLLISYISDSLKCSAFTCAFSWYQRYQTSNIYLSYGFL